MKAKTLLAIGLCAGLGVGILSARTWTSADGSKTFEGEFKSYDKDTEKVTVIMRNGRSMTFDTAKLSETDQEWIQEQPGADGGGNAEDLEEFQNSELGKALKDMKILDGRRFAKYEYTSPPDYYILYFSASW